MKTYNKLVRDKIEQIIIDSGKRCRTRVLSESEYLSELNRKLQEEVAEFIESGNIEELADVLEVIRTIADARGVDLCDIEEIRKEKKRRRGGFSDRIFLESVDD